MDTRASSPDELSIPVLDQQNPTDVSTPAAAAQESLVETSLLELSALLIVVLGGLVLMFAGAIAALSWW
jgi:hypothetical protein